MRAIRKNREQMPFPRIRGFRFTAGQRTEMTGKVGDVIDACKHVKQMPLRNLLGKSFF